LALVDLSNLNHVKEEIRPDRGMMVGEGTEHEFFGKSRMKRNCLVLGACGFMGTHLVKGLLREGHQVRAFDLPVKVKDTNARSHPNLEYVGGRFDHKAELASALRNVDIVFHLVGTTVPQSSNEDMVFDIQTNLIDTVAFLHLCVQRGVKRVLFPSSGGTVYGIPLKNPVSEVSSTRPICSYGIVKLAIEHYLHLFNYLYGLKYVVLRISNPYGPGHQKVGQGVIPAFLKSIKDQGKIDVWGDGSVVRDYIFINDVVEAFLKAMVYPGSGSVFNIGSGAGGPLTEIIGLIKEVLGVSFHTGFLPGRKVDVPAIYLDISLAREKMGWQPEVGLREGIALTWEAMCS
jgi:UDP-glucose 4-epimerase